MLRPDEQEGASPARMREEHNSQRNSKGRGPEMGLALVCSGNGVSWGLSGR